MKVKIDWKNLRGTPVTVADTTLIPHSQALVASWPGGGMVWHRPYAMGVQGENEEKTVDIPDVTRMAQLLLYGFSLLAVGIGIAAALRKS